MSARPSSDICGIRCLTPADFGALLQYDWHPLVRERDTIYLFLTQDHAQMSLVAEESGGEAAGYVIAARSADGKGAFVFHLHVRRGRRRRGIGRALMRRLEANAREMGVERVWLLAGLAAREFYERMGYVRSSSFLEHDAARQVRDVKNASVLVKEIVPAEGPIRRKDAAEGRKRAKDG
jgi:ribosomal protein S18 acetylase RimI-like enzyme